MSVSDSYWGQADDLKIRNDNIPLPSTKINFFLLWHHLDVNDIFQSSRGNGANSPPDL